jgi:hypothetical protein
VVIRVVTSRDNTVRLIAVLALALAVRLVAVIAVDTPQQAPRTPAESDAPTYYALADHLLDGTGYRYDAGEAPTAKRTPGYPLFIASIFKVFGRSFTAVRLVQCVVDVATAYLVFALTVLALGSAGVGVLAALGYAVYLPAVQSTTYIMTETTYTFSLVLATTLTVLAARARNYLLYAISGITFGISAMVRPGAILLPFALLVVSVLTSLTRHSSLDRGVGRVLGAPPRRGFERAPLAEFAVLCLAFAIAVLPWTVRNQRALGRWIPTSTLVGANLYKGNHIATQGAYFWSTDSLLAPDLRAKLSRVSEAEKDRVLYDEAWRMILANKKATALLVLKKIPRLWLNLGYGRAPSRKSVVLAVAHLALLGLGVLGLLGLPADARVLSSIPLTTVAFSTIMYLTVAAEVRFVFPLIPLVLPYSALGLAQLAQLLRSAKPMEPEG